MVEWNQVIVHVDFDSFFASVHVKFHPFLKGYPVIIGSDPQNGHGRGVVSTCTYEARIFGVRSGLPISQAFMQCPHGIFICSRNQISFNHYREESEKAMEILQIYSDKFQQAGLDEAYLDISDNWHDFGSSPRDVAKSIQKKIMGELTLPISVGIAETKSIAKIGSDLNKPYGIAVVHNSELEEKLYHLPVRKIIGVGKKTEKFLQKKGIETIGDIASMSREKIFLLLGKHGLHLRKIVLGENYREVGYFRGGRKSISSERTFREDQEDWKVVSDMVDQIVTKLVERLRKNNLLTRTVSIKIRFQGYETFTRSISFQNYTADKNFIFNKAMHLLQQFVDTKKKVRLIGVRVSSLKSQEGQLELSSFFSSNPSN
ncbi:MAG: DNA polymerase IV [Candidatus Hodarchaeales archaeon]|jgi:DNA polymerase IV (DinB-like DNA polymerase)